MNSKREVGVMDIALSRKLSIAIFTKKDFKPYCGYGFD